MMNRERILFHDLFLIFLLDLFSIYNEINLFEEGPRILVLGARSGN